MEPHFPVFVLAKDDLSVRMTVSQDDLWYFEEPDIKEGLYVGWDLEGNPFNVVWDSYAGPKIEMTREEKQLEKVEEAIVAYGKGMRPDAPFMYVGPKDDVVKLYDFVENHIKAGRFIEKVKRFFNIKLSRRSK